MSGSAIASFSRICAPSTQKRKRSVLLARSSSARPKPRVLTPASINRAPQFLTVRIPRRFHGTTESATFVGPPYSERRAPFASRSEFWTLGGEATRHPGGALQCAFGVAAFLHSANILFNLPRPTSLPIPTPPAPHLRLA